ncbi:MAG TPA: SLC13 family permease [Pirellulales bacterium]|jgi:di/tricarboxylate transporter|nr:SLC13 family permease [Pirellulales bacterium]
MSLLFADGIAGFLSPAQFTLLDLALIFGFLIWSRLPPDVVLCGGVALLVLVGILDPREALGGLGNEAMVTVGILYIVGAGVRQTGGVDWIAQRLFGRPKSTLGAIIRLMFPTAALSAFMNNTPLVAMLIPAVSDWSKMHRIAASKLMIPLSYAAILGGTTTLIGTSTNLVVDGQIKEEAKRRIAADIRSGLDETQAREKFERETRLPAGGLAMFDITWVGLPAAIIGCTFMSVAAWRLLPDRKPAISNLQDPRSYTIEMLVEPDSPLVGKTIEAAGLRHLPGAYLVEVDREGFILPAVGPNERLRGNDRLVFVGVVDSVLDLQKIRGLVPATDQVFKLTAPRSARCLIEAVVSNSCPMVGKTIRDGRFRSIYNAAVIAVARNGERINKKIGDIVLRPGDTLLLEAHSSFADQQRNNRDFFLVSRIEDSQPPRHERALVAVGILVAMVVLASVTSLGMFKAALAAAALMIATRCCSVSLARRSIDWEVLLAIAASFAIGAALEKTKAAQMIADYLIGLAQGNAWASLAVVYLVTLVTTELITNNAAAALIFPMAIATAGRLNANYMPFVIVVMMAASAGFATPIGYQTNLMVYGPGGYRFSDYLKVGVPLDILIGIITVGLAPFIWPL